MRKILLILDGIVAKEFVMTLSSKHIDQNYQIFVSQDPLLLPDISSDYVENHNFDPSSTRKLREILDPQITDCYIIVNDDRDIIYETIRNYSKNIQITMLGKIELKGEDSMLTMVDESSVLSAKLFERFPNVPRTAKYIGLGQGEIMQVSVPSGSPYAYRAIGSIKQKKWKIVAIYRNNDFLLPINSSVIFPNDSLLLVGEPKILWDIYYRIKDEIGQFPTPFGRDVVLYCDLQDNENLQLIIDQGLWLFNKFKNKRFHLCFFNPANFDDLQNIKTNENLNKENITWHIEYYETSLKKIINRDRANKNIGLIILNSRLFATSKRFLFDLGIPLLKLGNTPLYELTDSAVVIPDKIQESEKISSVVFDFSTQIGVKIKLYDFDIDSKYHKDAIDYYNRIAKIFEKKIETIISNTLNPIIWLNNEKHTIQIIPLKKEEAKKPIWRSLTNVENLSTHLTNIPQLFIPLSV